MAYEEIAAVLGVRIGTVRSRIARGRQRLREALEDET
jgi:RNA polymerase sigma-70 factor (ECF subfamily)